MHSVNDCVPTKDGEYFVKFKRLNFSAKDWIDEACVVEWKDGVWNTDNIKNMYGIQRVKITHWSECAEE